MNPLPLQSLFEEAALSVPFVVFALGSLGLAVAISRLERERERALVETGQYDRIRDDNREWILGGGLLLVAVGFADVTTAVLAGGVPQNGVGAAFVGFAALVYYFSTRRADRADSSSTATRA